MYITMKFLEKVNGQNTRDKQMDNRTGTGRKT